MLRVIELFGGIGACTEALKNLGVDFKVVDYVEIDKYAVKSYNAINGTDYVPQDIQEWDKDIKADLIMHGSPCQDFSLSGLNRGGDEGSGTRSSLMYETIRIVEKVRPKYVIWENVKNLISKKHRHNFDAYLQRMETLGYTNYYKVLNSKNYGVPQNRERVFTVSILGGSMALRDDRQVTFDELLGGSDVVRFEFPKEEPLKFLLRDLLEKNVEDKYYISAKTLKYTCASGSKNFYYKPEIDMEIARPLTASMHKMHRASQDNYCSDSYINNGVRLSIENGAPKMKQIAQLYGTEKEPNPQAGRVYSPDGVSPTLDTCSGGNRMPKLLIKNATKKGYIEAYEGDGVDLSYANSSTRRGRVQPSMSQTITCGNATGVVVVGNYMPSGHEASRIVDSQGCAPTVKENHGTVTATVEGLRIRKLTPLECWRLQAFSDESFYKAQKVNSNTQLYKQAGNSITVRVLEKILAKLLTESNNNEQ